MLMNPAGKPDVARVFFALSPDERCRHRLFAIAGNFALRFGGKAIAPPHLTLAFVGAVGVDRLPDLMAAASEVAQTMAGAREAGAIVLNRLHCGSSGKMLWATSDRCPESLGELADGLRRSLVARGYVIESRSFFAHVTLVRRITVLPQSCDLDALSDDPVVWPYQDFVLLRSRPGLRGSVYERLGSWGLGR